MSAFVVSKRHIDIMVQSAIAGATDSRGWARPGEEFSYLHDEMRRVIDPRATEITVERWREIVPPSVLGQRLVDENVRSVHGRYPDDDVSAGELPGPIDAYYLMPYVFEPATDPNKFVIGAGGLTLAIDALVGTAELAHGLSCYSYQSCEHDGWRTSHAYHFLQSMREHLLACLPGGERAPWGWD